MGKNLLIAIVVGLITSLFINGLLWLGIRIFWPEKLKERIK